MKKFVNIEINSERRCAGDPIERMSQNFSGTLFSKDGLVCLSYREDDSSGLSGTLSVVKIKEDRIELSRSGGINSLMVFSPGKTFSSNYSTPYGSFPLTINTKKVSSSLLADSGEIVIIYNLDFGGDCSENVFTLKYTPCERIK